MIRVNKDISNNDILTGLKKNSTEEKTRKILTPHRMNSLRISSSDLALDKSMSPLSKRDVYVGEHKKVYDELMKGKLSNQQKINFILYRTDKSGKSNS